MFPSHLSPNRNVFPDGSEPVVLHNPLRLIFFSSFLCRLLGDIESLLVRHFVLGVAVIAGLLPREVEDLPVELGVVDVLAVLASLGLRPAPEVGQQRYSMSPILFTFIRIGIPYYYSSVLLILPGVG